MEPRGLRQEEEVRGFLCERGGLQEDLPLRRPVRQQQHDAQRHRGVRRGQERVEPGAAQRPRLLAPSRGLRDGPDRGRQGAGLRGKRLQREGHGEQLRVQRRQPPAREDRATQTGAGVHRGACDVRKQRVRHRERVLREEQESEQVQHPQKGMVHHLLIKFLLINSHKIRLVFSINNEYIQIFRSLMNLDEIDASNSSSQREVGSR